MKQEVPLCNKLVCLWLKTRRSYRREISCQFLLTGGRMVPRYVLHFLFSETSQNCSQLSNHGIYRKKHRFGILRILAIFDVCTTKFKNNQILLDKICHRFILTNQAIYWVKEPQEIWK
jgi:hypothetical protein